MRKTVGFLKSLTLFTALGGLLLFGPGLKAQDASSQQPSSQTPQASGDQQQGQTFIGTIGKSHGELVLIRIIHERAAQCQFETVLAA
jgi:hypothetical protein